MRHRSLLSRTVFDHEDRLMSVEAALAHDTEVMHHCGTHGLKPNGMHLDGCLQASQPLHDKLNFVDFLRSEGLTEGIGSLCAEELCVSRNIELLTQLMLRRLLSVRAIETIIRQACQDSIG